MKMRMFQKMLAVAAAACLALLAVNALAQDSSSATAAPQLSYGVPNILQLAQAKIGDDTILAYIRNSRNGYNLNAEQIIFLHQQGVSDAIITAMLNQPKAGANTVAVPQPTTPAPQPVATYAQPPVTYVEQQPVVYYDYQPYCAR